MLRTVALRAARTASRPALARIVATPCSRNHLYARFESNQAGAPQSEEAKAAALKEARKLKDKLNHNWDAPILTYEQVKPKTSSPSPVRITYECISTPSD